MSLARLQKPPGSGRPQAPPGGKSASGPGPRSVSAVARDDLVPCRTCGRRFNGDRIQTHEGICAQAGQKKRKPFDAKKQRLMGTPAEAYNMPAKGGGAIKRPQSNKPGSAKKPDWRRKHEDFILTIRAAKQMKAHMAAGGKLSDLPPPPASDYSDYIQCPHCKRKFNEAAAERHIPKCAGYEHNKPKPKPGGSSSKR